MFLFLGITNRKFRHQPEVEALQEEIIILNEQLYESKHEQDKQRRLIQTLKDESLNEAGTEILDMRNELHKQMGVIDSKDLAIETLYNQIQTSKDEIKIKSQAMSDLNRVISELDRKNGGLHDSVEGLRSSFDKMFKCIPASNFTGRVEDGSSNEATASSVNVTMDTTMDTTMSATQPFTTPTKTVHEISDEFLSATTTVTYNSNRGLLGAGLPVHSENLTTETEGDNNLPIVAILVGCSALIVLIITVVLVLCVRRIRQRRRKRSMVAAKYDSLITTLHRTSPMSLISHRRQTSEPSVTSYSSNYSTFDIVTEYQNAQDVGYERRTDSEDKTRKSSGEKLTKYHSMDSEQNKSKKKAITLNKSKSNPILPSAHAEADNEHCPKISFTLKYDSKARRLKLRFLSVCELPGKCHGLDVSAVVSLFPRNVDGVHSRVVTGAREVQLNETFLFDDMTLPEVEKSTLRFVLHYKRKMRSGKEELLGELYMKCCDHDWSNNDTLNFTSMPLGSKTKSGTRDKYLLEDLGSLFVCLEYQGGANRLKVMVRKASGLPKSDKLIGEPGHYVVINLLKNSNVVKVQETKTLNGNAPIWNQPFLFDLSGSPELEYSVDFVIMRKKLHTKDAVIGHVTIGASGCRSGRSHWKDIMSPRPLEAAKWHAIGPVIGKHGGQQNGVEHSHLDNN